ncbi:Redoxin [Dendrothele bispora CBS 962.96]|uniref:Putative peroxiredoxin n=1 Tax=Dendrothele bispora (strain CBS 962.96) TaxID=1314807 RepID=A0A4S8KUY9_DENBC|nr:Redoxin [Dendrothele bispora CBS 962.96]
MTPPTPTLQAGDTVPDGTFRYIPYTEDLKDTVTQSLDITEDLKGKKVVLFSVPGAFTPTCHVNHLPPYLQHYDDFKAKGVDIIAVVAANDPFVMSGWGRFEGVKDKILCLSDPEAEWSGKIGLALDMSQLHFGIRTARYAMIIDDLVITYIATEPGPGVTVTGAEALLAEL